MEDTLQRVFSIILSVMIFFLLPLYMAFEKKDDISYSLALKITSNFVDEVCNKGYMTIDMYNDLVSDLAVTGNSYDIKLEHIANVYNPVIYAYKGTTQHSFDYNLYKDDYVTSTGVINIEGEDYTNPTLSYKISELRYTTDQILRVMDQDAITSSVVSKVDYTYKEKDRIYDYTAGQAALDSYIAMNKNQISPVSGLYRTTSGKTVYPMNKGDKFTVVIKNTNVTIASMLFNTLTFGAKSGADTKVYINYGGTIKNEEYRDTVIDTTVTDKATNLSVEDEYKELDVNQDTHINEDDKDYLLNKLISVSTLSSQEKEILDLNKDDKVDTQDSVYWVTNFERMNEKSCRLLGHIYVATELKDASQVIKNKYSFNDETISYSGKTGIKYSLNIKTGDIVYTSRQLHSTLRKGYYRVGEEVDIGTSNHGFKVENLGESYKVNVCSRCGESSI